MIILGVLVVIVALVVACVVVGKVDRLDSRFDERRHTRPVVTGVRPGAARRP